MPEARRPPPARITTALLLSRPGAPAPRGRWPATCWPPAFTSLVPACSAPWCSSRRIGLAPDQMHEACGDLSAVYDAQRCAQPQLLDLAAQAWALAG